MKNLKYIIIGIALALVSVFTNAQTVYTVTKTTDPDPFEHPYNFEDSLCDPEMYGTLQWAVRKTNDTDESCSIVFNIPGTCPHTIYINYYLPQITNSVIIDGTTQPGYNENNPAIIINGQYDWGYGLNISQSQAIVRGLHMTDYIECGIYLSNATFSEITNCIINNISQSQRVTPSVGIKIFSCNNITLYGNIINTEIPGMIQNNPRFGVFFDNSFDCIIGGQTYTLSNTIYNCGDYGINLNNSQSIKISGNIIYNNENAIGLRSGSNNNIQPPEITEYTDGILYGTALPNATIEVFGSIGPENANEYLGSVVVDGDGEWSIITYTNYESFVANQRDLQNNTSIFYFYTKYACPNCIHEHTPCDIICNPHFSCMENEICGEGSLPNGWCNGHGSADWCSGDNTVGYIQCEHSPDVLMGTEGILHIHSVFYHNSPYYPDFTAHSESAMTYFLNDLVPGQEYTISFLYALDEPVMDFAIYLVKSSLINNIPNPPYENFSFPNVTLNSSNSQLLLQGESYDDITIWQQYTNTNFVSDNDYDAVWIYIRNTFADNDEIDNWRGHVYINDFNITYNMPDNPEAYANANCVGEGEPIELYVDFNDAQSYEWSGPDGFTSNLQNPIVEDAQLINSGTYCVTVTLYGDCKLESCVDVHVQDVNVTIGSFVGTDPENNWIYIFDYSVDEHSICPGNNHLLRALPSGASSFVYEWNVETPVYYQINANPPYSPFVYMVTVTSEEGCTASDSFTINHYLVPPTPNPTSNVEHVCSGGSVILSTDQLTGDYRYQWYCSGMYNAGGFSYDNYTVTATDVFNNNLCEDSVLQWIPINGYAVFTCQIQNEFGCISQENVIVYIDPEITECDYFYQQTNSPVCVGEDIELYVFADYWSLAETFDYVWYGPNSNYVGNNRSEIVSDATINDSGYYSVLVTTENGCSGVLSTQIDVIDPEDFTIEQDGSNCEFDDLSLIVSPYYEGLSYSWYGPEGYMGDSYALHLNDITTDMSGEYYCNVSNSNECTFTLYSNVLIDLNPLVTINNITHCDGDILGSATINIYSENTLPYEMIVTMDDDVIYQDYVSNEQVSLENLYSGLYQIAVISENGCVNYYDLLIMGNCDEFNMLGTLLPRTCEYLNNAKIRIDICGGTPPYSVYTYQSGIFSDVFVFWEDGTYEIDLSYMYISPSGIVLSASDAMGNSTTYTILGGSVLAWTSNDVLTNDNIESNYTNRILCIGTEDDQTLNIPHNVTFTNCTIYTATYAYVDVSETQWTVYNPYDLVLDNTTIQSGCPDQMWQGIKAWGGCGAQSPEVQSLVEIKNGSVIMDAMMAVESVHGAIVKATNSSFINNRYDIYMHPHCSQYSLTKVDYNIFKTDGKLNDPDLFPKAHVYLDYIRNLTFKGNTFTNLNEWDGRDYANVRGIGIDARQSYFVVTPVSPISASLVNSSYKNSFNGLYYGVRVSGQRTYPPKIQHNQFTNNFRGVKLTGTTGARIIYNTFYTLDIPVDVDTHFGYTANNTMSYDASYAAYLDRATNTWFEENKIFDGMAGAYVYNTGTTGTRFYRNNFGGEVVNSVIIPRGMDAATIVVGQNSNWDFNNQPIINTGLEVRCNDYTDNGFAISVFNGNMRKIQGTEGGLTNQLAGNQFHTNMVNGKEFNVNIENELGSLHDYSEFDIGENYKYYQHYDLISENNGFHRELIPEYSNGVTGYTNQNEAFITSQSCPSNFGIHHFDIGTAIYDISARKTTLDDVKDQYDQTVDRGDTEYMLTIAETLSPRNFRQYVPVLSNNGYLSDTVFMILLDNTTAQKPVIASVLIANSPLPENILYEVNNSDYLSNGHKIQINKYQSGTNSRILLEYQISDIKQEIKDIEGEIINNTLNNDSIPGV
ncbi:MAG: NosD domain-containing protein, partial [Bacteroidales bacterium]|nr:NosD domain-containing protein [Bacteroidales bacterium]